MFISGRVFRFQIKVSGRVALVKSYLIRIIMPPFLSTGRIGICRCQAGLGHAAGGGCLGETSAGLVGGPNGICFGESSCCNNIICFIVVIFFFICWL